MSCPGSIRPAFYLAGPTAVGKSSVAVELAVRLGGEILTADSMQVYRGMDIGTAKPTVEREVVPHHLIDLVDPTEGFDAARWLEAARRTHAEVQARGRVPVFCGGTGLYFRAWLEGLDPMPAADPELRRELESMPLTELLAELAQGDPEVYARLDRQNPRRVVRAVEILRLGGAKPLRMAPVGPAEERVPEPILVLRRSPEDLRRRMEQRVDAMFSAGLVEETRGLLGRGLAGNRTAMQAIGYRQVAEYLGGERDLAATVALIKTRTWQYGRRQVTWFRQRPGVVWVDIPAGEPAPRTAQRILDGAGVEATRN